MLSRVTAARLFTSQRFSVMGRTTSDSYLLAMLVMACILMACVVMAYVVMACIIMAFLGMAYTVMACKVMAGDVVPLALNRGQVEVPLLGASKASARASKAV